MCASWSNCSLIKFLKFNLHCSMFYRVLAVGVAPTLTVYYQSLSRGVSCIYPTVLELRQLVPESGSFARSSGARILCAMSIIHHSERVALLTTEPEDVVQEKYVRPTAVAICCALLTCRALSKNGLGIPPSLAAFLRTNQSLSTHSYQPSLAREARELTLTLVITF